MESKVLHQCRQKQLWKDKIYVNEDYSECAAELRKQLAEQKKKKLDNRESLQRLCIRNLWYRGSITQHKFSLMEFQTLFFFCTGN